MSEIAVKRILIIRLSAIGDVVFASPLVAACRQAHPNAEIDWLAEGVVRPLLQDMPGLHEVVLWPRQEWEELWREKRLIPLSLPRAARLPRRSAGYSVCPMTGFTDSMSRSSIVRSLG